VAIIPQDPVLFAGTIKSNIDPLDYYNDKDIATCLQKV
jgi:ABC-type multidrug transport system fused ATPase/permease subunit